MKAGRSGPWSSSGWLRRSRCGVASSATPRATPARANSVNADVSATSTRRRSASASMTAMPCASYSLRRATTSARRQQARHAARDRSGRSGRSRCARRLRLPAASRRSSSSYAPAADDAQRRVRARARAAPAMPRSRAGGPCSAPAGRPTRSPGRGTTCLNVRALEQRRTPARRRWGRPRSGSGPGGARARSGAPPNRTLRSAARRARSRGRSTDAGGAHAVSGGRVMAAAVECDDIRNVVPWRSPPSPAAATNVW